MDSIMRNVLPLMDWNSNRWDGIIRPYSQKDVEKLRGTADIQYTLADLAREPTPVPESRVRLNHRLFEN